jgi:hypothetical protein
LRVNLNLKLQIPITAGYMRIINLYNTFIGA